VERAVRRAITRGIMADAARLRAGGARVCLVTPEPEDLAAMGVNLMNPARRSEVLETAQVTAARQLNRQLTARAGWPSTTSDADAAHSSA
jgi:NTE family protein